MNMMYAKNILRNIFHLWDLSGEKPVLLILTSDKVLEHTPIDSGQGNWESVTIGFDLFNWENSIIIEG